MVWGFISLLVLGKGNNSNTQLPESVSFLPSLAEMETAPEGGFGLDKGKGRIPSSTENVSGSHRAQKAEEGLLDFDVCIRYE